MNPVVLQTDRLILRELEDSDFEAVHAYASDPLVVQFMPWGPNTESDTSEFLGRARTAALAKPRVGYELAVTLRSSGTLVGAIGLHREDPDATEAMLGYCFSRAAWGHGFATEAGRAMIRYGILELGLKTIWAGCDTENVGSIRVLEKLGMRLESAHRHETEVRGEWSESLMFKVEVNRWPADAPRTEEP